MSAGLQVLINFIIAVDFLEQYTHALNNFCCYKKESLTFFYITGKVVLKNGLNVHTSSLAIDNILQTMHMQGYKEASYEDTI